MARVRGIPSLEGVANRIRKEVGIPLFPPEPDPATGRYRPQGWYMVNRSTGERVIPVANGVIVKRKKTPIEMLFGERRR